MALEEFAKTNDDDAVLFGPNKRPFLAATIQTYVHKFAIDLSLSLLFTTACKRCENLCQAKPYSLKV